MQYSHHQEKAQVKVVDSATDCPELDIVEGEGEVKVLFWPGNGAFKRSMHYHELSQGACLIELQHPSDCIYYVIKGTGTIDDALTGERQRLIEGSIVHIDKHECYRVIAGDKGITFVGGPCPPDNALYAMIKTQR
ncbi:TPA: hypothetical protein ACWXBG_005142 [Klebsiella pneumoniae]|nr:hypothetical protein [Klebsiella pneumoniae]STX14731.1 Uncharacterised protein [Klebsiella pneumoniae]HCI6085739.1 hypothetical protein [Klebsiella pneumoniae]